MAQVASGVHIPEELKEMVINIRKRSLTSLEERWLSDTIYCVQVEKSNWIFSLFKCLENPNVPNDRKTRMRVVNYVLFDKELYKKS